MARVVKEGFARWDAAEMLVAHPDEMGLYLEACIDEDPGDGSVIRAALNDIVRAQNMSELARETGMTRAGIYRALANDGNPSFTTILKIIQAMGLRIRIEGMQPSAPE